MRVKDREVVQMGAVLVIYAVVLYIERRLKRSVGRILCDDIVVVEKAERRKAYPERMRWITARIEGNSVDIEMVIFSSTLDWAVREGSKGRKKTSPSQPPDH